MRSIRNKTLKYTSFAAALAMLALLGVLPGLFRQPQETLAMYRPAIIGHRGSAHAVENTIAAMEHAIAAGVDYVEVDVTLSADGIPVVFHDYTLQRLTGVDREVGDFTATELKRFTLVQNGQTAVMPTLQEVMDFCRGETRLLIELKPCRFDDEYLVNTIAALIDANGYNDSCLLMSQNLGLITMFEALHPACSTGYCRYGLNKDIPPETLLASGFDFLVLESGKATRQVVAGIQSAGIPVYICTLNDSSIIRRYIDMGAAGIVSDYPDVAAEAVRTAESEAGNAPTT